MAAIGCPVFGLHADFPEFIIIRVPIVGFLLQYGSLYKFAHPPPIPLGKVLSAKSRGAPTLNPKP